MNRRQAFARFTPHSTAAASHARARRRQGQKARIGKASENQIDPAAFRDMYLSIYNSSPGLVSLMAVVLSLGSMLTELIDRANDVEQAGGGSAQLKLELMRRREDWFEIWFVLMQIVKGESEAPEADLQMALDWTFKGFPQDQGKYEYENGSQLPPRYGLAWEVGTLYNQVWAMWHPITWVGEDPDEPWYTFIPTAIAAGWVDIFNEIEEVFTGAPDGGAGWGAKIAQSAEQTEAAVVEIGEKGYSLAKKALGMAGGALLAGLLVGGLVIGGRRR